MRTLKHIRVGELDLKNGGDVARIERNLFANVNGEVFEALRFCKRHNGRHNRVHLIVKDHEFAELFVAAYEQNVFSPETIARVLETLQRGLRDRKRRGRARRNPLFDVIGICKGDGTLAGDIDGFLYGKYPA
jgi:hypothetical protein